MSGTPSLPDFQSLLDDVRKVRESGLGNVRRLQLPSLMKAARAADVTTSRTSDPAALEQLLRMAVDKLGGGAEQDAAEQTLGLAQGTKLRPAVDRRRLAAQTMGVQPETFRKNQEHMLLEQVAEGVFTVCRDAQMRQAHIQMERRHPADSRLAVAWVERFEAYYRMWTPIYALGADLGAAVQTSRDEPSDHYPWDPNSVEAYDPAAQAQSYARHALYRYALYLLELKRFIALRGGLWLFSDTDVEEQVSDAVYRIGWHNPITAEADSWLRRQLADSRHEEQEHFSRIVVATSQGQEIHRLWQDYVAGCHCVDVELGDDPCQVHSTIRAAKDYCALVDGDWLRIADWYRPGSTPKRGVEGSDLYSHRIKGMETSADGKSR